MLTAGARKGRQSDQETGFGRSATYEPMTVSKGRPTCTATTWR
ncbi:hypothetical protein NKH18_17385 [Streptomyces sp. M10(2022)]